MTKAEAIALLKRIQEPEAWEPQINQAAFEALDMAIKALEQEPCEDTISRQAAIDALDVLCQEHRYKIPGKIETYSQYNEAWQDALDRAEGAIFNLPSAQPEQRWIPCSERLPEEYGEFLVTMTEKAKAKDLGFDIDETYIRKMRYNSNGWQLPRHIPSWINEAVKDEVLAWMPLPEPYQEEGEKDGKDT